MARAPSRVGMRSDVQHSSPDIHRPGDESRLHPAGEQQSEDIRIAAAGASRTGAMHDQNDDRYLIADLGRWCAIRGTNVPTASESTMGFPQSQAVVLAVADGVSGQGHGDFAASVVIETLWTHLARHMPWRDEHDEVGRQQVLTALNAGLKHAQIRLTARSSEQGLTAFHVGTTATVAYIAYPWLFIAHVGDSRAYLVRNNVLYQLTRDQTAGAEMRRHARPESEARRFDHMLTHAIVADENLLDAQLAAVPLRAADRVLLCSDGLPAGLAEQDIVDTIVGSPSVHTATSALVEAAALHTRDDVTAVLASATVIERSPA